MKKARKLPGEHQVQYGRKTISYALEFQDRSRLSISVYPDKRVVVVAPQDTSLPEVQARVMKHLSWINRQRNYFERFNPLPSEQKFISGETHLYLGRHYRLKIRKGEENSVKLKGRFLVIVSNKPKDTAFNKNLLMKWYKDHARELFQVKLEKCLQDAPVLKMHTPKLSIRSMATRW
jgi:predicted metal-dependent hydrolase